MTKANPRPERTGIMLAYPATPRRVAQLGELYLIQPKLNGERCWVEWFNKETPVLVSSYGNEFKLPHITDTLLSLSLQGLRLDGELYIHGEAFETIHSIASASRNELHPRWQEMELHVFDYKSEEPTISRLAKLEQLSLRGPLKQVPSYALRADMYAWEDYAVEFVKQGYEGIILRDAQSPYIERRTPALLKFKPTHEDTYRIVDTSEGIGWATGMLGSFIVEATDQPGQYFRVGSGKLLTKENRQKLWAVRAKLPGKLLRVKHEEIKTTNGIPKCAVALEVVGEI